MPDNFMFPGLQPNIRQMFEFGNVPGMGGPTALIAQMLLEPFARSMMGNIGMVPTQFIPSQNMFDMSRERAFFFQNQAAMRTATLADQETYINMQRGLAHLTGTKFDLSTARTRAEQFSTLGPILAMMAPDVYDALSGSRGAAGQFTHFMHMGGRYGIDPITGSTGISATSAGEMGRTIFQELYGPHADISKMRGFGGLRAGQMYDELTRRGFMGMLDRNAAVDELVGQGWNREELLKSPQLDDRLRAFDASRSAKKVQEYTGVISAMRDIFGDMGKPNAPMPELFKALDALTQGGTTMMSADKLEMMARKIHQMSVSTGMGMEGMSQLINMTGGMVESMGLYGAFAPNVAMGGAAFGHAFGATGAQSMGIYGLSNKSEMMMLGTQLQARATKSPAANQLNTVLRLATIYGADEMSEFGRLAGAIQSGQMTYDGGKSIFVDPNTLRKMAKTHGISEGDFNRIYAQIDANLEYGLKYNTGDLARRGQMQLDIMPFYQQQARVAAMGSLGLDNKLMPKVANLMANALKNPALADIKDEPTAINMISKTIMAGLTPDEQKLLDQNTIKGMAANYWGSLEQLPPALKQLYKSRANLIMAGSPKIQEIANIFATENEVKADLSKAMSSFGQQGPLRRFSDLLQQAKPNMQFSEVLGYILGGVPGDDMMEKLKPLADKWNASLNEKDPAQRIAIQREIVKHMNNMVGEINQRAPLSKNVMSVVNRIGNMDLGLMGDVGNQLLKHYGIDIERARKAQQTGTGKDKPIEITMKGDLTIHGNKGTLNSRGTGQGLVRPGEAHA